MGDKLVYKGFQDHFWYTDIIDNARLNLEVGREYTLSSISIHSSWCSITLKETGDIEYSLSFFERK